MYYIDNNGIVLEILNNGERFFNGIPCKLIKESDKVFTVCFESYSTNIRIVNNKTFEIIENTISDNEYKSEKIIFAEYGIDSYNVDVTKRVIDLLKNNNIFEVTDKTFDYFGPKKWKKLKVTLHTGQIITCCEGSFFSLEKIKNIKLKLQKYNIKEYLVYETLDSFDENTDYFEDNIIITIINHSSKTGFVVSKENYYAGFYCFVNYYFMKIKDILFFHKYNLLHIFSLDGFSVYKDTYSDDLYKIIFNIKNIPIDQNTTFEKFFSESETVKITRNSLLNKYNINPSTTLSVYYRGTDKKKEVKLPDFRLYVNEIMKHLECKNFDKILLQTDSSTIFNLIKSEIQKKSNIPIIDITELPRSEDDTKSAFHHQASDRVKTAIFFNSVLRIIADSDTIILNPNSNVSQYIFNIRDKSLKQIIKIS